MKKLIIILMALLMLGMSCALADTGLVVAGTSQAVQDQPAAPVVANRWVIDKAGLFTPAEGAAMLEIIERVQDEYQIDLVVLTVRLPSMSDRALQDYADCYFDDNGYGTRGNYSGALLMIDMGNRYIHLSTSGDMIDLLTDSRVEAVVDACYDQIHGNGQYGHGQGAIAALNKIEKYLKRGRANGSFRYDAVTGRRISGIYNKLTVLEIVLAIIAGTVVTVIIYSSTASRYNLKNKTYQFNKSTQSSAVFYVNDARFLRETVRRIPRSTDTGSHHGGSGGHRSGGSAVHHSSSGHSHGGGGRHF